MTYYRDDQLLIRSMVESDIAAITAGERAQGWHVEEAKQEMRFRHQQEGRSFALTAEYNGEVAGYINLYLKGLGGPEAFRQFPEIVDFGVLMKFQRRGVGSRMMDAAEQIAAALSDTVYLGVGMHHGYGSAQRMYVKRGYIPDGSGVWYNDRVCPHYAPCCNDDDLVLYLSKRLH